MVLVAQASPAMAKGVILASPAPLVPYVQAIVGTHGDVRPLLSPSQDAHTAALTPSQAQALHDADLLVVADRSMMPALDRVMKKNPALQVIELRRLPGADPLPYANDNPWIAHFASAVDATQEEEAHAHHHDHNHDHDHATATDPHLWLDPERMAAIAEPLAQALAPHLPGAEAMVINDARALAMHLRHEVLPGMRAMLPQPSADEKESRESIVPFVTYHAAYQYFLARMQLTRYGELLQRPEDYQGATTTARMITQANAVRIGCLISEQRVPLVERIAKASGARVVLHSPEQLPQGASRAQPAWVKNDYDRMLFETTRVFASCLP
jgi:zinc transport system substrate-binding protein